MNERPSPFTVIVDTREQQPFGFAAIAGARGRTIDVSTLRAGLPTGDYSIMGLDDAVAIERKSKADLFGSVGRGRDRFEREIERLAALACPAIVLECDLGSILRPPERSRMSPVSVLNTLIAWSVRYRIPIWPCPGRRFAEIVTYRLLQHFHAHHLSASEEPINAG